MARQVDDNRITARSVWKISKEIEVVEARCILIVKSSARSRRHESEILVLKWETPPSLSSGKSSSQESPKSSTSNGTG